jgi:hypothetical protein
MTTDLPVLTLLPVGVVERPVQVGPRVACGLGEHFHWCQHCGGWILGPALLRIGDRTPAPARPGVRWYCRRCDREIAAHWRVT